MNELRLALAFSVLLVMTSLVGCATTAPKGSESGSQPTQTTAVDSARKQTRDPVGSQDSDREIERSLTALRTAYVEQEYEAVARRARRLLQDSLRTSVAARVYTMLGRAEHARGQHEAAIDALRQARLHTFEAGQSVVHVDQALGESYAALYRWSEAASAFRRVLDEVPENRSVRQSLAKVYKQAQDWSEAQEQYARLVRADSTNGRWWAQLAQCDLELGQTDPALRHFARAHRLLPQSADIALPLSRLYRSTNQHTAARSVIDTTLSHQASDPRLWRRRADLAFEQNALERACRAYRRTIAMGDSSATAYRRLGLIDVQQQAYANAISPLQQSLRRNPMHPRTTLYLGIAYQKVDSLDQAARYLQQTIDREVEGPITEAFVHWAATSDQQGDVQAAVRAYKTALRLQPERKEIHFRLANVYDRHYEDKAPAARYYRQFLRMTDTTLTELRHYAEKRLGTLRPVLHMQEGGGTADTADGR